MTATVRGSSVAERGAHIPDGAGSIPAPATNTAMRNLWLDDVREPWRHGALGWVWAKTVEEAKDILIAGDVDRASLDHDLGLCDACIQMSESGRIAEVRAGLIRNDGCASYCSCRHNGTGYDLVCWMEETGHWPRSRPVVHSANRVGAARMQLAIDREAQRRGGAWEACA